MKLHTRCLGSLVLFTPILANAQAAAVPAAPPASPVAVPQTTKVLGLDCDRPVTWTKDSILAGRVFTLRQSATDIQSSSDAATIQWTENNSAPDSFATDAALTFIPCASYVGDGKGGSTFKQIGLNAEYHRSTVTKKKVDTGLFGATWDWVYTTPRKDEEEDIPGNQKQNKTSVDHIVKATLNYKNDRQATGQGITASLSYALGLPCIRSNELLDWTGQWSFYWLPSIALQAEHADGLSKDPGEAYRLKGGVTASLYPFASSFNHRFILSSAYSGWYNAGLSGAFDGYSNYQKLFVAGATVVLLEGEAYNAGSNSYGAIKRPAAAIALDYRVGAEPDKGKPSQSYTQLTLKLQL